MLRAGTLLFCLGLFSALSALVLLALSLWTGDGRWTVWFICLVGGMAGSMLGIMLASKAKRREWQPVLDREMAKWESEPVAKLREKLQDSPFVYAVTGPTGAEYQIEVEFLEDKPENVHVAISVDDGTLPASIMPAGGDFVRKAVESEEPHAWRFELQLLDASH